MTRRALSKEGPAGATEAVHGGCSYRPRRRPSVAVIYFLAIGLALWAVISTRERFGEHIEAFTGKFSALPAALVPKRSVRYGAHLAGLAIAVIWPLYVSSYWQEVLVDQIGVYVLLAIGLNVVMGYAGLLDLGYVAFYAIGAYATPITCRSASWSLSSWPSSPWKTRASAVLDRHRGRRGRWAPQCLRVHPLLGYNQQDTLMYSGAVLIVMMIFRPVGIVPSRRRRREFTLAESGVGPADAMVAGPADRSPVP